MGKVTVADILIKFGPAVVSVIIGLIMYIWNTRIHKIEEEIKDVKESEKDDVKEVKNTMIAIDQKNDIIYNKLFDRVTALEVKTQRLCSQIDGMEKICAVRHEKDKGGK